MSAFEDLPDSQRWNSNIHYHGVILESLTSAGLDVLDVGCGEGLLCRQMRAAGHRVTGIDTDGQSIDRARRQSAGDEVDYICDDFLERVLEPSSLDAVVSVATLHHMDPVVALQRMKELLRPGGTLAIVGLARSNHATDLPMDLAGVVDFRLHRLTKSVWNHPSPILWPPPHTYREIREVAQDVLPGVRYRRHLQWRYSLVWRRRS